MVLRDIAEYISSIFLVLRNYMYFELAQIRMIKMHAQFSSYRVPPRCYMYMYTCTLDIICDHVMVSRMAILKTHNSLLKHTSKWTRVLMSVSLHCGYCTTLPSHLTVKSNQASWGVANMWTMAPLLSSSRTPTEVFRLWWLCTVTVASNWKNDFEVLCTCTCIYMQHKYCHRRTACLICTTYLWD